MEKLSTKKVYTFRFSDEDILAIEKLASKLLKQGLITRGSRVAALRYSVANMMKRMKVK